MTRQNVGAGDNSVNLQAGENVAITVYNGPSLAELKTYVDGVFAQNFLKLTGEAERVAEQRARHITEAFINQLFSRQPDRMSAMGDPAMLSAVFDAQSAYAKSGEEDLAATLVALLLDRAQEPTRNLRSIVLEGAIQVAPRITAEQRAALGMVFAARYVTELVATREEYVRTRIVRGFLPLMSALTSVSRLDLQHLEYLGCGASSLGFSLEEKLAIPRYFARGFDPSTLPVGLRDLEVTIPDPDSDDDGLCVLAPWVHDPRMREGAAALLKPFRADIDRIIDTTKLNQADAREALRAWIPDIEELSEEWENSGVQHFTLTSVGIAIGHSYWASQVSDNSPLSIWIN